MEFYDYSKDPNFERMKPDPEFDMRVAKDEEKAIYDINDMPEQEAELKEYSDNTRTLLLSKKGVPCLWESGGGMTSTGYATVICGGEGEKKSAIYMPRSGHLSCGEHALIPVKEGDCVVTCDSSRRGEFVNIEKITKIDKENEKVYTVNVSDEEKGSGKFDKAIEASMKKANMYHCRSAVYADPPKVKQIER